MGGMFAGLDVSSLPTMPQPSTPTAAAAPPADALPAQNGPSSVGAVIPAGDMFSGLDFGTPAPAAETPESGMHSPQPPAVESVESVDVVPTGVSGMGMLDESLFGEISGEQVEAVRVMVRAGE